VLPCPCGRVVVLGLNSVGRGYEVRVCKSGTNIRAKGEGRGAKGREGASFFVWVVRKR